MMPSYVPLAPSNLVRSPVLWSAPEVKAWLKFCIQEFALKPVNVDKFDMNGKALLLLTKIDFMQRAPHAGDVLFNAFQHLQKRDTDKTLILAAPENASQDADSSSQCGNQENRPASHASDHGMECTESIQNSLLCPNVEEDCPILWVFIYQLLQETKWSHIVCWQSVDDFTFHILNPTILADEWGKRKNRFNMTYEKLSRALRYYYRKNIIRKVAERRLTYQFMQHPSKIKKGRRGAKPRSSRVLTVEDACTPDSSTYLPARSAPFSLTADRQLSSSPSSTESSPRQHNILIDSLENVTSVAPDSQEVSHLQNVSSSADSKYTTDQQGPFSHYETTNLKALNSTVNTNILLNKSSYNHYSNPNYCDFEKCDPPEGNIKCTYQSPVCTSEDDISCTYQSPVCTSEDEISCTNQSPVCTSEDDINCTDQSPVSSHEDPLTNNQQRHQNLDQPSLADMRHKYDLYNNYNHSFAPFRGTSTSKYNHHDYLSQPVVDNHISQHKKAQEFTQDMNPLHNSSPLSPTCIKSSAPLTFRSNASFSSHTREKPATQALYKSYEIRSMPRDQNFTPLLFNHTSHSQDYWEQQHFSNRSVDYHHQNLQALNEIPVSYQYGSDFVYCDQNPNYIKKHYTSLPIEHESCEQLQSVPEDLSMKPSPKKQIY